MRLDPPRWQIAFCDPARRHYTVGDVSIRVLTTTTTTTACGRGRRRSR
jgi:hypothetical protein